MACNNKLLSKSMSTTRQQYVILNRTLVLVVVFILVVLIVYWMPMPEEYFLDCDRECHELDWPMICRIKLTVEVYKTMSRACGNCNTEGGRACKATHCITADGRERGVLTANRLLPAPRIHVCRNDILVVDVVNRAPSHSLAIHWRGQPQRETPFMDGAPMLTQCPSPSFTTFQYKFRASEAGTHMYHAHSGADTADGLAGALVVRLPARLDPLKHYYDEDLSEHVMLISEWGIGHGIHRDVASESATSLLINGMSDGVKKTPHEVFNVRKDVRYRFRVAYTGGSKGCSISITIHDHMMKVIALDGNPIMSVDVDTLQIGLGERADFVLKADQELGSYDITLTADQVCQKGLKGYGELRYEGADVRAALTTPASPVILSTKNLNHVYGSQVLPEELSAEMMDITMVLPFHYTEKHKNTTRRVEGWGYTDGHRFTYPASPLLTQGGDVNIDQMCHVEGDQHTSTPDECVHVRRIPTASTVEIIMIDQGGESDHIFHLHGYSFFVIGTVSFNQSQPVDHIKTLNRNNKLFKHKNLRNPPKKDTIIIPKYGAVALRFKADNPGYWLMRDERSSHWTRGLDFVLKVGDDSEFVQPPVNFPKCGSYIGPEYFLI